MPGHAPDAAPAAATPVSRPTPARQPKEPLDVIIESLPQYWDGFLRTLFLSVVSGIIALIFGTLLAAARV